VRFRDSRDVAWDSGVTLVISNWTGSLSGGGTDRLYVGSSAQGLSPTQLNQVRFANPAGLPAGNYSARILSTGEVVPSSASTGPPIGYMRSASGLTVTWDGSYELYSAPTISGPWTRVEGAASPYPVSFTDPQRYFVLRSASP